jgi:DNA-binding ferritin-like protein (Dps family)
MMQDKDIIQYLREIAKEDRHVSDFLIDLFFEEQQNPVQRSWKERYRQKLEEYIKKLGEGYED